MTDERADQAKDSALTAEVHPNHLPDLRYALMVLEKIRDLVLPTFRDEDSAHGEIAAALNGMRYIIKRTEEAPAAPPAPVGEPAEWHDEKPDEWTPLIEAAHPLKSHAYQQWDMAVQMVGNRRDKYALVELVCWLLQRAESASPLPQEVPAAPAQEPVATAWMKDGVMVNAFPHRPLTPEQWARKDHDGYWSGKGYSEAPLYASPLPQEVKALTDEADDLPPVHIDRERMERALAGPRFTVPKGLTQEQIGAFLTAVANAYKAGAKDRGAQEPSDLPVQWTGADGTSHEITLDYAARIAKWMFDTHGDVPQVDAVLARGAQEVKAGEWLPIESAPKDGTPILLTNGTSVAQGWWEHQEPYIHEKRDMEGHYIDQDEYVGYDGWLDCDGGMLPEPTHWMPLPPPPSATLAESTKGGQR